MNAVEKFFHSYGIESKESYSKWNRDFEEILLEVKDEKKENGKIKAADLFFDRFATFYVEDVEKFHKKEINIPKKTKNALAEIYGSFFIDVMRDEQWENTDLTVVFNPDYYYRNDVFQVLQEKEVVDLLGKEFQVKSLFTDAAQQLEDANAQVRRQIDAVLRNKWLEQMKQEFPDILWNYLKRNKNKITK